jgi:hypothetical protein
MDTDASIPPVMIGVAVYVVAVAAILGGLLLADWRAGRKRRQKVVKANPDAGRDLVRVGYRVQRNWHRYRQQRRRRGRAARRRRARARSVARGPLRCRSTAQTPTGGGAGGRRRPPVRACR